MGFFSLRKGIVSPFEEIVLMSIRDVGYGATFMPIFDKAGQLGRGFGHIRSYRVEIALRALNMFGFIYSWQDPPRLDVDWIDDRCFRIMLRGERALEAAEERRAAEQLKASLRPPGMLIKLRCCFCERPRRLCVRVRRYLLSRIIGSISD